MARKHLTLGVTSTNTLPATTSLALKYADYCELIVEYSDLLGGPADDLYIRKLTFTAPDRPALSHLSTVLPPQDVKIAQASREWQAEQNRKGRSYFGKDGLDHVDGLVAMFDQYLYGWIPDDTHVKSLIWFLNTLGGAGLAQEPATRPMGPQMSSSNSRNNNRRLAGERRLRLDDNDDDNDEKRLFGSIARNKRHAQAFSPARQIPPELMPLVS
ncbi:hypothetical protein LTR17_009440 [Elasticomyces elasticus]|nr:hypothetical protein LTR17_009440 [Elasticomyces elasticus]